MFQFSFSRFLRHFWNSACCLPFFLHPGDFQYHLLLVLAPLQCPLPANIWCYIQRVPYTCLYFWNTKNWSMRTAVWFLFCCCLKLSRGGFRHAFTEGARLKKQNKTKQNKNRRAKKWQQNRDSVTGGGRPTSLRGLCSAPLLVSFKRKMQLFYSLKNGDKALAPFAPPLDPPLLWLICLLSIPLAIFTAQFNIKQAFLIQR